MKISKIKKAEKICGLRDRGTPFDLPCELDYNCPICHAKCKICSGEQKTKELIHDETLQFSEYNYFMYCPKCNIDIPSLLCLRANTKRAVEIYTKRFLEMIQIIKNENHR